MTTVEVKSWINRARTLSKEIDALLETRSKAYDRCISCTARLSDVSSDAQGNSTYGDKLALYVSLGAQADKAIDTLVELKTEIIQVIQKVPDGTLRTLLIEYYINGKTWEQVAEAMNYSRAHLKKTLHPKALQEIKNILPNPT